MPISLLVAMAAAPYGVVLLVGGVILEFHPYDTGSLGENLVQFSGRAMAVSLVPSPPWRRHLLRPNSIAGDGSRDASFGGNAKWLGAGL